MMTDRERRKLAFGESGTTFKMQEISPPDPGQNDPRHYPQYPTGESAAADVGTPHHADALGEPLGVREVAELLGCSDWTVRHGYLPQGLPHLRSGPLGKLVFFRNQVVRWVLQQQEKGGI